MSVGKLTLLSADCEGSGAVVGSSAIVADSSGVDAGGCCFPAGGAGDVVLEALGLARVAALVDAASFWAAVAAARWVACSAARSVTTAVPRSSIAVAAISQFIWLFRIAHHPESNCVTGAVRAISCRQPQVSRGGRLPVGAAYHVARAVLRAQRVRHWCRVHV